MAAECNTLLIADGRVWLEIARPFWPVVAAAFLVSLAATPICRRIALRRGIVDRPDDFLKPHGRPTPYLGGVAIFLGWATGIAAAFALGGIQVEVPLMCGIAVAGLAIMLIGLFDDLRAVSPGVKLLFNVAVALLLLGLGLGDDLVRVAAGVSGIRLGSEDRWLMLIYSVPVTLLVVVGACNATNLIDGLDGLCTGVLGIISVGFAILAIFLRWVYPNADVGDERIVLALAMLGAAAGFLPFNMNPARIFMGDAGSMLLGLNAAILILLFAEVGLVRWSIGAVMVFGLPVADMLLTLARRWRNGRPLMIGDRSHYYDQLCDRGLSVRKVVAISYLLSLAFMLVGISVIFLRTRHAILAYALAVAAVIGLVWKFDMAGIERAAGTRGGAASRRRDEREDGNEDEQ